LKYLFKKSDFFLFPYISKIVLNKTILQSGIRNSNNTQVPLSDGPIFL